MTIFIGIDPGKAGAAVALRSDGRMKICRFDNSTEQDMWLFLESVAEKASWDNERVYAVLEQIQPMPAFMGKNEDGAPKGMRGSIASMKIGESFGFCKGLLTVVEVMYGVQWVMVRPQEWSKAMGMSGGDRRKKKVIDKEAAQRLYPGRQIIHVTADAILLATFCKRQVEAKGRLGK